MDTALQSIVENIWASLLGMRLERADPQRFEPALTGCVFLTGDWQGAVLLDCARTVARDAAAAMFGLEPAGVTRQEMDDALAELNNIAAGNFKAMSPAPCSASLPKLLDVDGRAQVASRGTVVARLAFRCEGAPVHFTVLEDAREKRSA